MITPSDFALFMLMVYVIGYFMCYFKMMDRLQEVDKAVYQQFKDENRHWWNNIVDAFKVKTTEQKIAELQEEIKELENDE